MTQVTVRTVDTSVGGELHRWISDSGHNPAEVVPGQEAIYDLEKGELKLDVYQLDKEGSPVPNKSANSGGGDGDDSEEVSYKTKSVTWKVGSPNGYGVL